jgi:hypothetical protein
MIVATLHGIGLSGLISGYADPLFSKVRLAGVSFRGAELFWRAACLGPLAWWALGFERVMRSAQEGLRELTEQKQPVVLVTHSAGCRIAYNWFSHRLRPDPFVAWVSCGANQSVLEGVAIPIGFKPAHLPPWSHFYRDGDVFGGPLARYGAIDCVLPVPLIREHINFWEDQTFAQSVARIARSVLR